MSLLRLGKVKLLSLLVFTLAISTFAQKTSPLKKQDTLSSLKKEKQNPFNTGFYPVAIFDIDLRYLVKFNNYEGLRLGIGGITNEKLFDNFKIGEYFARGFRDNKSKYSVGGSVRLNNNTNSWLNGYYIKDIQEFGSYYYLTDKLIYSIFEPRLLNITLFYKHRT